jgi:hypothetical protein
MRQPAALKNGFLRGIYLNGQPFSKDSIPPLRGGVILISGVLEAC